RRMGIPAVYRLQVMDYEQVRARQDYRLDVDGIVRTGTTDAEGVLEEFVAPDARAGRLVIGEDDFTVLIDFGHMDPIEELSGIQKRLTNLGYECGEPDGTLNDATRSALARFQARFELEQTGEVNDETLDKLQALHDGPEDFPEIDESSSGNDAGSGR
ncbi:MAG: peptidoglycan-binding domain-containing protein, partial [Pseudomonadota bacterium]